MYTYLASGRATDPIPAGDFQELLLAIATLPGGHDFAIEILYMRLHSERDRQQKPLLELVDTGRTLLEGLVFSRQNHRRDHRLRGIAESCLRGGKGASVTFELCQRLKHADANHEAAAYEYDDLLIGLLSAQPLAALDGLCRGDTKEIELGLRILRDTNTHQNPLDIVSDDDLLYWCDQDPQVRYPAMAGVVNVVESAGENVPPALEERRVAVSGART